MLLLQYPSEGFQSTHNLVLLEHSATHFYSPKNEFTNHLINVQIWLHQYLLYHLHFHH